MTSLLEKNATKTKSGVTWLTPQKVLLGSDHKRFPQGYYNLGLAHGAAGVIAFLAASLKKNKKDLRARDLLRQVVLWVLSQNTGSHYASYISKDPKKNKLVSQPRLAWCYGDLGIAVALYNASKALADRDLEKRALNLAHRAANFTHNNSRVIDAYLCHGGIGAFHIFNHFYQWTGDHHFLDAALKWLDVGLKLRKKLGPSKQMNILTGEAGLGLALLSGVSRVSPIGIGISLSATNFKFFILMGTSLD